MKPTGTMDKCQHMVRNTNCKNPVFRGHGFCATHMVTDAGRLCHPDDRCKACFQWSTWDDWRDIHEFTRKKVNAYKNPKARNSENPRNQLMLSFCSKTLESIKRTFADRRTKALPPLPSPATAPLPLPSTSTVSRCEIPNPRPLPPHRVKAKVSSSPSETTAKKLVLKAKSAARQRTKFHPRRLSKMPLADFHYTKPKHSLPVEETVVTYLARNNIQIRHPSEMCANIEETMKAPDLHESKTHLQRLGVLSKYGLDSMDKDLGSLYAKNTELRMLVASLEAEYTKVVDLIFQGKISKVRQADLRAKDREIADLKARLSEALSQNKALQEDNALLQTEIALMKSISPL